MIDPSGQAVQQTPPPNQQAHANAHAGKRVLRMVKSDRMGGSIPVWENARTPQQEIEHNLSLAQTGHAPDSFKATLAYRENINDPASTNSEFGFGDLFDMINPLQHIPILGHVYRAITGDDIKPIGRIVGGAVFGGALGAASGLVNVIVQEETGRDITGNALALAMNGEAPAFKNNLPENPEERLNDAARTAEGKDPYKDLPGALLAFADLGYDSNIIIEKNDASNEHAIKTTARNTKKHEVTLDNLPPREPITQLSLRTMPYEIY